MNKLLDLINEFKEVVVEAVTPYKCFCCRTAFVFF